MSYSPLTVLALMVLAGGMICTLWVYWHKADYRENFPGTIWWIGGMALFWGMGMLLPVANVTIVAFFMIVGLLCMWRGHKLNVEVSLRRRGEDKPSFFDA